MLLNNKKLVDKIMRLHMFTQPIILHIHFAKNKKIFDSLITKQEKCFDFFVSLTKFRFVTTLQFQIKMMITVTINLGFGMLILSAILLVFYKIGFQMVRKIYIYMYIQ